MQRTVTGSAIFDLRLLETTAVKTFGIDCHPQTSGILSGFCDRIDWLRFLDFPKLDFLPILFSSLLKFQILSHFMPFLLIKIVGSGFLSGNLLVEH